MDKEKIIEYLKNKESYLSYIKHFDRYYNVLEKVTKDIRDNPENNILNKPFIDNISFIGAILFSNNQYKKCKELYCLAYITVKKLYSEDEINYKEYNKFENMLFLSYVKTDNKRKSLVIAKQIIQYFYKNYDKIKKNCDKSDKSDNIKRNYTSFVYLIKSMKDLSTYAESISKSLSIPRSIGYFYYKKKKFESIQLSYLVPNNPTERIIRNIHYSTSPYELNFYFMTKSYKSKDTDISKTKIKLILRSVSSKLSDFLWGYGEHPLKILRISTIIIVTCGVAYKFSNKLYSVATESTVIVNDFLTSLYFSMVTFTTLGYGDYFPGGWIRIISSFEAISGMLLMAAFLASLTRKYLR